MTTLRVELGEESYPVLIETGLLNRAARALSRFQGRRIALVSGRRIWSLHGAALQRQLRRVGKVVLVLIPDGEPHKSRRTLDRVHDAFLDGGLARDGLVIAFGGGVVGDLAGYAAATYMRGVPWVPIPTTLLAMVDSSVGGKVGINHPKAKNLLGAFHQPALVLSDPALLCTLPPRELRSGAYEIIKCGILGDARLFAAMTRAPTGLSGWSIKAMAHAITAACRIKAQVVSEDEHEGGLRRVLNLGHTLGHAFEAVTRYRRFTHGEAIGWGMIAAGWIAHRRGLLTEATFDTIAAGVDHLGPRPRVSDLDSSAILAAVARDKKARAGRVPFILPVAIGKVVVRSDVKPDEVRQTLRALASRERG